MGRIQETIDGMTPAQRGTLGALVVLVLLLVAVLVVVLVDAAGTGAGPPSSVAAPTTSTTSVPTSSSTTTSPSTTLPGSSSTATTTTTEPTTTTTLAPERALTLRPDGLGDLFFGDDAERVHEGLVEVLGEPDEDTGWVDQQDEFGTCLGDEVRFVRWRSLTAFYTDGPSDWAPADTRHFAAYTHAAFSSDDVLDMVSADGLEVGSPVGDVRAVHGPDSVVDEEPFGPLFVYDPPGFGYQWGEVTGTDPDDTVVSISGGFACGE